jgi:hypothetical protein
VAQERKRRWKETLWFCPGELRSDAGVATREAGLSRQRELLLPQIGLFLEAGDQRLQCVEVAAVLD